MKMDDIQRLLQKYHDGTLTPGEQAELDRLTHKDEVLGEAFHKADGIVRRRQVRYLAMAMTGLVLLGAGVWMARPSQEAAPLVAGRQALPAAVADEAPAPPPAQPTVAGEPVLVAAARPANVAKPAPKPVAPTQAAPHAEQQTVVVCNTQCEADSVINNIWKFLSA
ncbi:MAG: hypothetical protein SPL12_05200 [Bacteroidales bacterium]|nr:hypothetical protein [Bacteroidales bacterium]